MKARKFVFSGNKLLLVDPIYWLLLIYYLCYFTFCCLTQIRKWILFWTSL